MKTVNLSSSKNPNRYKDKFQAIEKSDIYVALASKSFFEDANSFAEFEYAKFLKKKSLIFLQKGLPLPENIWDGLEIVAIIEMDYNLGAQANSKIMEEAVRKYLAIGVDDES